MKRALLIIETLLVVASAGLLGYAGYAWFCAYSTQVRGRSVLNRPKDEFAKRSSEPQRPAEGALIGQIEIPQIGLSSVILEGTEPGTLRRAVGHVPGTALPGQPGNLCLAGHRDTFFRPLRKINVGDRVIVRAADSVAEYRVQSTQIVHPEDIQVLDNTPVDTLTLITCYPFRYIGAAPKRFVVRAARIA